MSRSDVQVGTRVFVTTEHIGRYVGILADQFSEHGIVQLKEARRVVPGIYWIDQMPPTQYTDNEIRAALLKGGYVSDICQFDAPIPDLTLYQVTSLTPIARVKYDRYIIEQIVKRQRKMGCRCIYEDRLLTSSSELLAGGSTDDTKLYVNRLYPEDHRGCPAHREASKMRAIEAAEARTIIDQCHRQLRWAWLPFSTISRAELQTMIQHASGSCYPSRQYRVSVVKDIGTPED